MRETLVIKGLRLPPEECLLLYNAYFLSVLAMYQVVAKICSANQWTGFYMIGTSVMRELNKLLFSILLKHLKSKPNQLLQILWYHVETGVILFQIRQ